MRLLTLTTLLTLLATLVLAQTDGITCRSVSWNGEGNRDIVQAINAFCGWTWDLVSIKSSHPIPSHPIQSFTSLSPHRPRCGARQNPMSTLANPHSQHRPSPALKPYLALTA